jgi:hypothetical protein
MHEIDDFPTNLGETPFDPFSPAKLNSKIVNPETGHSITYGSKGQITEQALAPNFWTRGRPAVTEPERIKPKGPRTAEELTDALSIEAEGLAEELNWYQAHAGTNPQQEKIVWLKIEIAKLQDKLRPLQQELEEAQSELPPTECIVKRVSEITMDVQGLARESAERKLIQLAKEKYDVSDLKALDRQTIKNLQASDTIKSVKDLTLPFWSRFAKGPRIEDLNDATERLFAGIDRLINFLSK